MQQLEITHDMQTADGIFQYLKAKTQSFKHERFHEKKRKNVVEDRVHFYLTVDPSDNLDAVISGLQKVVISLSGVHKTHHPQIKKIISDQIKQYSGIPIQHRFTVSVDEKDKADGVFYVYRVCPETLTYQSKGGFDYSIVLQ